MAVTLPTMNVPISILQVGERSFQMIEGHWLRQMNVEASIDCASAILFAAITS